MSAPAQKTNSNPLTAAVLFIFFLHHTADSSDHPDTQPLLLFRSAVDPNDAVLSSWNSTSDPCTDSWVGVSCIRNRVARLVLEDMNLQGLLPHSLTHLTQLRVLSLKKNGFSGQVPDLSSLTSLRLLFISHNHLSGEFPVSLSSLYKLCRLDLSYNNLSGGLPLDMNRLTHLLTLRLEENRFTGPISGLNLSNLQDFNVSGNGLTGEIPGSLSSFPLSSFSNNPDLCGASMKKCDSGPELLSNPLYHHALNDPIPPAGAMASPVSPKTTVDSSATSVPSQTNTPAKPRNAHRGKISSLAIIAILVGGVVVLGFIPLLLYYYSCSSYTSQLNPGKSSTTQVAKIVYSSGPCTDPAQPGSEWGKMVFLDEERRFELEDLLRASTEMLGKGAFGTAYKAKLDNQDVVAVKRLKGLNMNNNKEFEQQLEVLWRFEHPNLVGLRAYYFAMDDKLLVHDYMPNGNLFWLLHGNRGPGRIPLDWTTRLKIASGSAHGLAFLHGSSKPVGLVHGNLKSTNVLIDREGDAKLSDYGLSIFSSPSSAPKPNGYLAPEAALDSQKLTQQSDVYSFGVLLLELLTGKCPSINDLNAPGIGYTGILDLPRWVQSVVREGWAAEVFDLELMRYKGIQEEMMGLLKIAMACTQASPDQRPGMSYVVNEIEKLRGVEILPSHDLVSESPAVSGDTGRASE